MFHNVDNPALLCYSKTDPADVGPPVLVIVNLDAHHAQHGFVDIDLQPLGLPYESSYDVRDQLTNATYRWQGARNFIHLDPSFPAHVFRVDPA